MIFKSRRQPSQRELLIGDLLYSSHNDSNLNGTRFAHYPCNGSFPSQDRWIFDPGKVPT